MKKIAWETEYSVEAEASLAFAWSHRINVANWDDPPAEFELHGPFAAGTRGTTRMPGQEPLHWQIGPVCPMQSFTMEMPLDRATLSFEWRFDELAEGRTRLTQHIVLKGENAAGYVAQVQAAFAATLADGMNRIAGAIAQAEANQ